MTEPVPYWMEPWEYEHLSNSEVSPRVENFFTGRGAEDLPSLTDLEGNFFYGPFGNTPLESSPQNEIIGLLQGAIATGTDDREKLEMLQDRFPDLEAREDEYGSLIVRIPEIGDQEYYINPPGIGAEEILGATGLMTMYGGAGGVGAAGPTIGSRTLGGGLAEMGTEYLRGEFQRAQGAQEGATPLELLLSGAGGAAGGAMTTRAVREPFETGARLTDQGYRDLMRQMEGPRRSPNRIPVDAYQYLDPIRHSMNRGRYLDEHGIPFSSERLPDTAETEALMRRMGTWGDWEDAWFGLPLREGVTPEYLQQAKNALSRHRRNLERLGDISEDSSVRVGVEDFDTGEDLNRILRNAPEETPQRTRTTEDDYQRIANVLNWFSEGDDADLLTRDLNDLAFAQGRVWDNPEYLTPREGSEWFYPGLMSLLSSPRGNSRN